MKKTLFIILLCMMHNTYPNTEPGTRIWNILAQDGDQPGTPVWDLATERKVASIALASCADILESQFDVIESNIDTFESKVDLISTTTVSLQSSVDNLSHYVFGYVNTSGTIVNGTGFTIMNTTTGTATITFDTPFSSTPFIVATLDGASTPGPAQVSNVSTTGFILRTFNPSTWTTLGHPPQNRLVYFIAAGN